MEDENRQDLQSAGVVPTSGGALSPPAVYPPQALGGRLIFMPDAAPLQANRILPSGELLFSSCSCRLQFLVPLQTMFL
jgi:hypothetical protein